MRRLLAGFIAGAGAMIIIFLFWGPTAPRVAVGKLLDDDIIYMKSGNVIHGQVVKESQSVLTINTGGGILTLPRDKCLSVTRGAMWRYLRRVM